MVDGACSKLDRERDRPGLGELVTVKPQLEPVVAGGFEIPPRLDGVEGAALEEHVGGLGDRRGVGEHVGDQPVDVLVGAVALGRHGVRAEERRDAALRHDRAQGCQLGLVVEPVARLRLERRRALAEHPAAVAGDGLTQSALAGGAGGRHRREDPASRCVQLLVRRARGAKRELLDPVARKARVRVAIDEAGDRAASPPVDFDDVAVDRLEIAHASDRHDLRALAEDERVLDDRDLAEKCSAQRRCVAGRRHELTDVADEQAAHAPGSIGRSSSCSRAAAIASS